MMTKEEFYNFIKSFNKKEGNYTENEIYAIGLKHKELSLADRDWTGLVLILGLRGRNGEWLRCWVKRRQLEEGTLPKNSKMISSRNIEDLSKNEIEDNLEQQKRDLYKQEVRTRDVWRGYREDIRSQSRTERFCQAIGENMRNIQYFTPIKFESYIGNSNKEAVLLFSDLHLGDTIDNFYNKYNVEIAKKRIAKLASDTIEYCKINKVRRLNVVNLGDMIQGLIHVNARIEQEIDVVTQIVTASEIISEFLNEIQKAAPEIYYRSCTDNHSRAVADLKQNIEKENFNKLIDFYVAERLKNTSIKFMNDNLDDDIGLFTLLNGETMVFVHGHRDNYTTAFQNFVGATKKFIKYVAMGHYHNSKVKSFQSAKIFVNGCINGSDGYAQSKRLFGPAEQSLLIFDGNNVSITYINLDIKD